ncbi:flagellar assembly protein FliW [Georgenia thermotolerans]|uniref:Flagellar assembly factor FliW n=1 Tax=Georgenia thermotolerans TaxID=527326 RepID=A0A7J5UNU6_9MICO|nr:flagellar assembly protein FliW [Georgenia thermotolerans]KAE8764076.1 flagellar assembly protein FliW [Georgenia thermotolerans]
MSATAEIAAESAAVLTFLDPPPGLGHLDRFALTPLDEGGQLFTLRSVEAPETRLFLLDPEPFFPDYHPRLAQETLSRLGLNGEEQPATVLVVVHPATEEHPHTANLLAPVVINPATATAVQTVLEGDDWPLRAPLSAA